MFHTVQFMRRSAPYFLAVALVLVATILFIRLGPSINSATISMTFVLAVLLSSLFGGFGPGILSSLFATLCFNYFFLPPKGTLTIADPQDWVALTTFLFAAVIVSHLSSSIKKRALEAERKRDELSKLYRLSQALIEIQYSTAGLSPIAQVVTDIFGLEYCSLRVVVGDRWEPVSIFPKALSPKEELAPFSLHILLGEYERGVTYIPIKAADRQIGILTVQSANLAPDTLQAIASLLGLVLDRARLIEEMRDTYKNTK